MNSKRQRILYIVTDWVMSSLAWLLFNFIRYVDIVSRDIYDDTFGNFLSMEPVILGQIFFPLMMTVLYWLSGYYKRVWFKSRTEELVSTLTTALLGTVIIFFAAIINDPIPDRVSNYELLGMLFALMFVLVYTGRVIITTTTLRRMRRMNLRFKALIVGTGTSAMELRRRITAMSPAHPYAYDIVGYVEPDDSHVTSRKLDLPVHQMDDLADVITQQDIRALVVIAHRGGMQRTLEMLGRLFTLDIPVLVSPTLHQLITSRPKVSTFAGEPLIDVTRANMSDSTIIIKRCADVILSALALVLLSPVFLVIAISIKIDSPGAIFYKQQRIGLHKKPFNIIKFRSMYSDAEAASGPCLSSPDDHRITHIGRVLRKYRLDELPQFYNVLKGDMSIIGPRPERAFYIKQIMEKAPYYALVHQVRPGITSLGMVKHGYASTVDQMVQRLQYDIIYLENISLMADLKIFIYTLHTVFTGKGI